IAAWGLLAVAALVAWVPATRRLRATAEPPAPGRLRLPWGSGVAWPITLYMGSQSLLYYAALTWLSPLYLAAGWSASRAGLLLGLFSLTQVFSALAVPAMVHRTGDHPPCGVLGVGGPARPGRGRDVRARPDHAGQAGLDPGGGGAAVRHGPAGRLPDRRHRAGPGRRGVRRRRVLPGPVPDAGRDRRRHPGGGGVGPPLGQGLTRAGRTGRGRGAV